MNPTTPTVQPWEQVDWSKPGNVIAQERGCSRAWVSANRRIHAPKTVRVCKPSPDWGSITNWGELSNAKVAAQLGNGLTIVRVADYRRKHKLPLGPRSPGTGLYLRTKKYAPRLTQRECRRRLVAVWDLLWPDRNGDPVDKDEVAEIRRLTTIPLANG